MLCLYLETPFAVCRTFTAGWYRPTTTFLTPSAAYGLALNVAGIETRLTEEDPAHDGRAPATLTRAGLPKLRIAIGALRLPDGSRDLPLVQTVYQQLHNYPVGAAAGVDADLAHGTKNNISPVRRELLVGLRALICLDANEDLETRVRQGLAGQWNARRYGLPFVGDNQLLPDRLEERPWPQPAFWYERITAQDGTGPRARTTRLTVWIDRADMSKTVSYLYAPTDEAHTTIPEAAWTPINPP
jgi:CRISPR-associated protein Cas5t